MRRLYPAHPGSELTRYLLQDGRLRGLSVQLQHKNGGHVTNHQLPPETFNDVAFNEGPMPSAAQAQRAYVASSSGALALGNSPYLCAW